MKTLMNKVIIYDDVCPLCKAYTEGFVQLGWLMPENRIGFATASPELLKRIDIDRARHEIPLFDSVTGETLYGKDALFYIIGEQFPLLKPLFNFSIFRGFIYFLYQIITYNRRIIVGSKAPKTGFDCAPDFNLKYRLIYILIAVLIIILGIDWRSVLGFNILNTAFLIAILRGVLFKTLNTKMDYFGHLATVALIVYILNPFLNGIFPVLALGLYMMWRRMH